MNVAALCIDTIRLRSAYDCEHDWQRFSETEDQCTRCSVIATPDGKVKLKQLADRFHGRPTRQPMTDQTETTKRLGENLKAALETKPPKRPLHRHRDDNYWDEIVILAGPIVLHGSVVPRYKTSGLSGCEWRISARLVVKLRGAEVVHRTFLDLNGLMTHAPGFLYMTPGLLEVKTPAKLVVKRKGVTLCERDFATFGEAAMGMFWHVISANEGTDGVEWHHLTDAEECERCQQVGCSEPPKNVYHLKKLQVGKGSLMVAPEYDFTGQYTWYCSRHTERGDCSLEDNDDNLELIEGSGVPVVRPEDESPSAFGGVVHVDLPESE